ncbi:MAG: hypothetical protein M1587_03175, partial [Thaumarchaeota archaeon]|nr:hypothetical protein [Nitrososphaerota archaeon]
MTSSGLIMLHVLTICDVGPKLATLQGTCDAVADPPGTTPSGNITWTSSSPTGTFSSPNCFLSAGRCSVQFFDSNASATATIVATYAGDTSYAGAEGAATLLTVKNGTALVDQNETTGLAVGLSGVTGSFANVTSNADPTQPNGTGTAPFATAEYFDLKVDGVTGGSATVCYTGPEVNASTLVDYYFGNGWNAASNVKAVAGVNVCGSIPVPALSGTPIAIGGANVPVSSNSTTQTTPLSTTKVVTTLPGSSISKSRSVTTTTSINIVTSPTGLGIIAAIVVAIGGGVIVLRRRPRRSNIPSNSVLPHGMCGTAFC